MQEALFYQAGADNKVNCNLCSHRCRIKPGRRGICGVRENRDGLSLIHISEPTRPY